MITANSQIVLSPDQHESGVRKFLKFFQLSKTRPDIHLLELILADFAQIPYENISKIIKYNREYDGLGKIRLPDEIINDHMQYRLGGTCFSLTFYLHAILTYLGFINYPVMADMRSGENIHCCIIAILGKSKYLLDPGYLLNRPMEILPSKPRIYQAAHVGVELTFDPEQQIYHLFTFNRNEMKWRYRFRDRPVPMTEFLIHWYASFEKNSMHGLCLTKMTDQGLIYIHKYFMRETFFTGKRNYNIKQNYHQIIEQVFGIDQEIVERALAALDNNMRRELQTDSLLLPKPISQNKDI